MKRKQGIDFYVLAMIRTLAIYYAQVHVLRDAIHTAFGMELNICIAIILIFALSLINADFNINSNSNKESIRKHANKDLVIDIFVPIAYLVLWYGFKHVVLYLT